MKIKIAGYNIDESIIKKLEKSENASPETISAAYARISRSSKSVTELREDAIREVQKARESNQNIIFDMGHSSIAEHAVYNIDVIGVSRYITETIQKSRLASFTEKSQRYVTLKNDFIIPTELEENLELKKEFSDTCSELFRLYQHLTEIILKHYANQGLNCSERKIKEMAKEDARYVLPLATKTQMGITINARSIEHLLRRLSSVNLLEAKEIRDKLLKEVRAISPSLIRYVDTDSFYINLQRIKAQFFDTEEIKNELKKSHKIKTNVEVIGEDMEERILAAFVFNKYPQDFPTLIEKLKAIPDDEKSKLFERIFEDIKAFHQVPKEFEMVDFIVQCSVSASCFAQLKRHRLMTIIRSEYKPEQGFVTPSVIAEIGEQKKYDEALKNLEKIYSKLELLKEGLGSYALTNAHRVNVIFKANLRELYHFSRLRSDQHAQWEIRELSQLIDTEVRKILPNAAKWLMGKDTFNTARC